MKLPNGHYRTLAGSEMRISGKLGGVSRVLFDWVEESPACCDCHPDPYEDHGCLVWTCNMCGGGRAELSPYRDGIKAEEAKCSL